MRTTVMRAALSACGVAAACVAGVAASASGPAALADTGSCQHDHMAMAMPMPMPMGPSGGCLTNLLLSPQDAKQELNTTVRHREWLRVPYGSGTLFAFVVYPDRANRGPVLLVNDRQHAASDLSRALADQAAAAGFLAVVPDVLTGEGPKGGASESFPTEAALTRSLHRLGPAELDRRVAAVRAFALKLPSANGQSARVDLDDAAKRIRATVQAGPRSPASAAFPLDGANWRRSLTFVRAQTADRPIFLTVGEHAAHYAALVSTQAATAAPAAAKAAGARPSAVPGPLDTSYARKRPDLPAGYYTAASAIAHSTLRKEWVTLNVGGVAVRAWIVYPKGEAKAGTVIVMQHGVGLDTWVQGVADQLAHDGFIAISPDIWSGTAPDGGGLDSFKYLDDAIRAGRQITAEEAMRRYKAARDYALKLPRSNGKTASLGFCMGGGYSFQFAGEVPELNGAVVFYGTPPDEAIMARIKSPVLGLFGENDARVVSAVAPAVAAMKRLGKSYEPHIYPKATHSFVLFQEAAGNPAAINDAWPRAVAFLRKQIG